MFIEICYSKIEITKVAILPVIDYILYAMHECG